MHSKLKSTPPSVIVDDDVLDRPLVVLGLTQSVAPISAASANFPGLMSTPMIRPAFACRAPWMTASPMPPSPNTATVSPAFTFAVLCTAPMPVVTPQPSKHTFSSRRGRADLGQRDLRRPRCTR
jgi:hypothetical protein